jgi:uncharacterized protein
VTRITDGHLARHYRGMRGVRDAAVLDIAQDHALFHLHREGLFERDLVFKGGTALRKFRAGNSGRFSTDLDFSAPSEDLALAVLQALDGTQVFGFTFEVRNLGDDGRRADLRVDTPFGVPTLGARVELSRNALTMAPQLLAPVPLAVHGRYEMVLPALPVVRVEEAIAEKLARYRRVSLARDLYDLHWFSLQGAFDQALVRRLWVLKVHRDVVRDGRGSKPLDPEQILCERSPRNFDREDVGYLTQPVRMTEWIKTVRTRYAFLSDLSADERRWATCNARDSHEVDSVLSLVIE